MSVDGAPPDSNIEGHLRDGARYAAGPGTQGNPDPTARRSARARSQSARRKIPWWRRPSAIWLLPGHFLFTGINGAGTQVSYEIMMRLACRDLEPMSSYIHPNRAFGISDSSDWKHESRISLVSVDSDDPEWLARCRQSSKVQKRTTRFVTLNMTAGGVLSAATSRHWASVSDRHGRKPVLMLAALSDIVNYGSQLVVALHPSLGFRFMMVGTAIAFSIGGGMTAQSVTYAYASDCARAGSSKASVFSLIDGCLSLGLILGPVIGSLGIRLTGQLLASFYAMIFLRTIYLFVLLFIIPESLSTIRRAENNALRRSTPDDHRRHDGRTSTSTASGVRRVATLLWAPISILDPRRDSDSHVVEAQPLIVGHSGPSRRRWNLAWLALSFMLACVNPAITPIKILYGRYKFGWLVEQTGYWTAFNSLSKLIVLVGVIPFITSRRRPAPKPVRPRPEATLLSVSPAELSDLQALQEEWDEDSHSLQATADSHFDLKLAKASIGISVLGYIIMSIPSTSPGPFLVGTAVVQGSGGVVPAIQSLALSITPAQDTGLVLAALSVLASITVQVAGPFLFGSVYIASVEWLPELAFGVAAVWWALAWAPTRKIKLD